MPEDAFAWHLRIYYKLKPEDVEPTETPGYWQIKEPCGGQRGECSHPLHGFIGCEGSLHHTVSYRDSYRDHKTGRFVSQFRTWKKHWEEWMAGHTRVRDITQLKAGDVLLVNNGKYSRKMTVHIPYDAPKEGRYAVMGPGVQCRLHATAEKPGHDVMVTEGMAEEGVVYLLVVAELDNTVTQLASDPNAEQQLLDRIMNDDD